MRILVVDDDAPNRKLLKDIVSRLGECDAAESGTASNASYLFAIFITSSGYSSS
jgi:CheY-like chemotaxis protein